MKRLLILWLVHIIPLWGFSQNCGLEDTLLINPNATQVFSFEIFDVVNDDLSDPNQGVCGVAINFVHQFSEDLELWLTAPDGTMVQLIGDNTSDQFAFTFFANWDITFVPCSDVAMPDSSYVPQWNNNQPNNFVAGGQYFGSYYPFNGCLEDFNSGPVNGTWTITTTNDPSIYAGAIIDFRVILCDDLGQNCCFADAGNLLGYDPVMVCEGDTALLLDIPPTYGGNGLGPDSTLYGYTYAVARGDTLVSLDSIPDLQSFAPGTYEVCGFSYRRSDTDSLPMSNEIWLLSSLRDTLDLPNAPFCGQLSDTCVQVVIVAIPDPVFLQDTLCAGGMLEVGDSTFTETGMYTVLLESVEGCDSLVEVNLTVLDSLVTDLNLTICEGDSVIVGNSTYTDSGVFTDILQSTLGCDSIVHLDLTVLEPIVEMQDVFLCAGDSYSVGDSTFMETGIYSVTMLSAAGCDSTVNLNLEVLDPQAAILIPDTITCFNPEITLDGTTSSPIGISYSWTEVGSPTILGNASTLVVDSPGSFVLTVDQMQGGLTCTVQDTVSVIADTLAPIADAGLPDTLNCLVDTLLLGGANTSMGPSFTYEWSTMDGQFTSATTQPDPVINSAGTYTLIVTDQDNGCMDTASVQITIDTLPPVADAGPDQVLDCVDTALDLDGTASSSGPALSYIWSSLEGITPIGATTTQPTVDAPATYILEVLNMDNFCVSQDTVVVTENVDLPTITIAPPDLLNCAVTNLALDASGTDSGPDFSFSWNASDGGILLSGTNSLMPTIGATGTYELVVVNTANQCSDALTVTVMDTITTPNAVATVDGLLDCDTPEVTLSAMDSSMGNDLQYCWSGPANGFVSDSVGLNVVVHTSGSYELIVKDTFTFCADTTTVMVEQDIQLPGIDLPNPPIISCANPSDTIFAVVTNDNPVTYNWSGPCVVSSPDSSFVVVDCGGMYTLDVVDLLNGCTAAASVVIQVDSVAPTVTIAPPGVLNCAIDSLRLDATGSSEGPNFGISWSAGNGGNFVTDENTLEPLIDAPGVYTLTITNQQNGCSADDSAIVLDTLTTIFANAGLGGLLTCDLETLILDGSASSINGNTVFEWFTPNGNILSDTSAAAVTVDAPGNYQLVVRDTFTACVDTAFVNVFQDTVSPQIMVDEGFIINCAIASDTLSGNGSATGPNITYQWSGPCTVGPNNEIEAVADCAGTYFLEIENTVTGCIARDSIVVLENQTIPIADAGLSALLTCVDTLQILDGTNSSAGPSLIYEWSGPGIVADANGLMPTVNQPGMYNLVVTDTLSACADTSMVLVTENVNQPIADAGLPQVITCLEDTVQIGGAGTTVGPDIVYQWFTVEGNIAVGEQAAIAQVDTSGVYVLFVTDTISGCADTAFVTTTIDQVAPAVNGGVDVEIDCASPEVTLAATTNTPFNFLDILWEGDCILTDPTQLEVTVNCPDDYIIQLTDTRNGCIRLDTVVVQFDSLAPVASLADSTFLDCELGIATIDGTGSTSGFYQWLFEGTPTAGMNATLVIGQPGNYELIVSNLDQTCSDTAQTLVVVDCAAFATVVPPDTLDCTTSFVVLDGSASDSGPEIDFFWETDDSGCITEGQGTPSATVNCSGFYTLIVTNTAIPVSDSVTVFVPIDTIAPVADAGLPDTLTCTAPFAVLNGGGSSQGEEYIYEWTRSLFEVVSTALVDTVFQSGNYFLEVTDTTNGCSAQDGTVILNSIVETQLAFSSTIFPCNLDTFTIQGVPSPPSDHYVYTWTGPGIVGGLNEATVSIDTAGSYILSVLDTINQCGVTDTTEVVEQVCVTCIDIAPPDTLTCLVDSVFIEATYCAPCVDCTLEWSTTDGLILDGQGTLTIVAGLPGSYALEVTDTLGQSSIFSIEVIADTLIPLADAGPDQVLTCTRTEVMLGGVDTSIGSSYSYQWSSTGEGTPVPDDQPTTVVMEPDTFVLLVENIQNGCSTTDTVIVTEEVAFPMAEAGPDQAITCDQSIVILDGSGSQTGNALIYEWTGPVGASISGASTLNPIVSEAGFYYLTVRDTTNGCSSTDSLNVALLTALPDLPTLEMPVLTCTDTIVSLDAMLADTVGLTFSWCLLDNMDMPVNCFETDSVGVTEPSRWQLEILIDSTGCSNALIVEVAIDTLPPIVDAGVPDTLFCTLDSLFLSGSVDTEGNPFEVAWTGPDDSEIADSLSLSPVIYEPGSYILMVTDTINGCMATDSVFIFGDENIPMIDAGMDAEVTCMQTNLSLNGSASTTSGQIQTIWSSEEGTILSGATTLEPVISGSAWYVLIVTDPVNGCAAIDSVFVAADTIAPTAVLEAPDGLLLTCDQAQIELTAGNSFTVTGNTLSFEWEAFGGGNIIPTSEDSVVLADAIGSYQVVVTDDMNGCESVATVAVEGDFESPVVILALPETITCSQESVMLDATDSSFGEPFDLEWNGPGGVLSDTTLNPTITESGTYSLTILNTENGCEASGQVFVPIDTVAPVAIIAMPDMLNCNVLSTPLDGTASTQGPEINYQWIGPVTGSDSTAFTQTDSPGVYTLMVSNARNGCQDMTNVEVIQTELPIADVLVAIVPPTCFGDSDARLLIDSIIGGTPPFLVALNGEPLGFTESFNNLEPGVYDLLVEDANGCQWSGAIGIEPPEELVVDLGTDLEIFLGDSTRLEAIVNGAYDTLFWSPANAFADPSNPVQVVLPLETAYYSVTAINANGCVATDRIILSMTKERKVFIPNVFSPNGDGENDVFMIFGGPEIQQIRSFKIFDRWGNWVFEAEDFQPNDPNYGWDGFFNGTEMNAAVYVFYAEVEFIDGWVELIKGDVILMR